VEKCSDAGVGSTPPVLSSLDDVITENDPPVSLYLERPKTQVALDLLVAAVRQRVAVLTELDRTDALEMLEWTHFLLRNEPIEEKGHEVQIWREQRIACMRRIRDSYHPRLRYSHGIKRALALRPLPGVREESLDLSTRSPFSTRPTTIFSNRTLDECSHWALKLAVVYNWINLMKTHQLNELATDTVMSWFIRNECQLYATRLATAPVNSLLEHFREHPLCRTRNVRILAEVLDELQQGDSSAHADLKTAAAYFFRNDNACSRGQSELARPQQQAIVVFRFTNATDLAAALVGNDRRVVITQGYVLLRKQDFLARVMIPYFAAALRRSMQKCADEFARVLGVVGDYGLGLGSSRVRDTPTLAQCRILAGAITPDIRLVPLEVVSKRERGKKGKGTVRSEEKTARSTQRLESRETSNNILTSDQRSEGELFRVSTWTPACFYEPDWLAFKCAALAHEFSQIDGVEMASLTEAREQVDQEWQVMETMYAEILDMRTRARRGGRQQAGSVGTYVHDRDSKVHAEAATSTASRPTGTWPWEEQAANELPLASVQPVDVVERVSAIAPDFPPCMLHMYESLLRERHLRHFGRLQLALFLKTLGLPLQASLAWWRQHLLRTGFLPNHEYNILHHYGQVGRGTSYVSYCCHDIQLSRTAQSQDPPGKSSSGVSSAYGCPFMFLNQAELYQLLEPGLVRTTQMECQTGPEVQAAVQRKISEILSEVAPWGRLPGQRIGATASLTGEENGQPVAATHASNACRKYFKLMHSSSFTEFDPDLEEMLQSLLDYNSPVQFMQRSQFWKKHVAQRRREVILEEDMEEDEELDSDMLGVVDVLELPGYSLESDDMELAQKPGGSIDFPNRSNARVFTARDQSQESSSSRATSSLHW